MAADEQHAEIGRTLAGVDRLLAHRIEVKSCRGGVQPLEEGRLERARRRAKLLHIRMDANGRQPPEPIAVMGPQALPVREGDERLGGRAVFVPVILVLVANDREVDGERGVPVGEVLGIRDAGIGGDPAGIGGRTVECDDAGDGKPGGRGRQSPVVARHEVDEVDLGAGRDVQVMRGPFVEEYFAVAELNLGIGVDSVHCAQRRCGRLDRGDCRIRYHAALLWRGAGFDAVRQVGEHGLDGEAECGGGLARGAFERRIEEHGVGFQCHVPVPGVRAERHAEVGG